MADAGLTIKFEHCASLHSDSRMWAGDMSGQSSPNISACPSPITPIHAFPDSPLDIAVASEDSWNLIPYDVPWGSEYYQYHPGTLPGPDGACIFLRSPTPLKNRRTPTACNKCRQRKAKCSGTRPTCSRCLARGYICQYVSEEKRTSGPTLGRQRRRDKESPSECSSHSGDASSPSSGLSSPVFAGSFESLSPKHEDIDFAFASELSYPDGEYDLWDSPTEYHQQWDDTALPMQQSYGYDEPMDVYDETYVANYPCVPEVAPQYANYALSDYHLSPELSLSQSVPSVFAPQPVRCTSSPTFLSVPRQEHPHAHANVPVEGHLQHNMLIDLSVVPDPPPMIAIPQLPPMHPFEVPDIHAQSVSPQALYPLCYDADYMQQVGAPQYFGTSVYHQQDIIAVNDPTMMYTTYSHPTQMA
ncbi:hypothetical protein A0H81_02749 [Grifola frondosa]|uniref:Zn(2)-C6 fungal-type domain-containing protein n=1 Tax=Grifola frondosa TaxID=5627 RepID=A0A1C7MLP7_GRIFR|nr:hypothetical protein A0H81_02749 [Grifola frondosa]